MLNPSVVRGRRVVRRVTGRLQTPLGQIGIRALDRRKDRMQAQMALRRLLVESGEVGSSGPMEATILLGGRIRIQLVSG